MTILEYIAGLRILYYEENKRIPTKLYIDYELYKMLRKELMYLPFGYHTILYYRDSISFLDMEIVFRSDLTKVGE